MNINNDLEVLNSPDLLQPNQQEFWELTFQNDQPSQLQGTEQEFNIKIGSENYPKNSAQDRPTQEVPQKDYKMNLNIDSDWELNQQEVKNCIEQQVNLKIHKRYQFDYDLGSPNVSFDGEEYNTKRRAEYYLDEEEALMKIKITDNFQFLHDPEDNIGLDMQQKNNDELIQKEIKLACEIPAKMSLKLEEKAEQLSVFAESSQYSILAMGSESKLNEFEQYVNQLITQIPKAERKGKYQQVYIQISPQMTPYKPQILQKGEQLEIYCEDGPEGLTITGYEENILELSKFIESKTIEIEVEQIDSSSSYRRIILSKFLYSNPQLLEKVTADLGLFSVYKNNSVSVKCKLSEFELFAPRVVKIEAEFAFKNSIPFIIKEFSISDSLKSQNRAIKQKAKELDLTCYILGSKLHIAGKPEPLSDLLVWLIIKEQKRNRTIQNDLEYSGDGEVLGDFIEKKEINISVFHRDRKIEIQQKAKEQDIKIEFCHDVIIASGYRKNVNQFLRYLFDIEAESKRYLYPKYWDFYEFDRFSKIEIKAQTEEYNEFANYFHYSLPRSEILKIERIQNRYLMDHYINMIQKRQELHQNENINRQFLFFGSGVKSPEEIFRSFDTGFDIQSARSGICGQGIYFQGSALHCHKLAYSVKHKQNTYQMLIADVFVGNVFNCDSRDQKYYIKPPEGYDCIRAEQYGQYVLYNNFHSYPLYLIEYRLQDEINQISNIPIPVDINMQHLKRAQFPNQFGGTQFTQSQGQQLYIKQRQSKRN